MTDGQRILVVDDQQDIRDMTALVLSGAGYRVETAESGESALSTLVRDRFDLVLLDINMPGMDGWETLRLIRCDEELGDVPVVMFSVKGEIRDKVESLQEGATDYVTKPFIVDDLIDRIGKVLAEDSGSVTGAP
ncbi:MAG: response regulator [Acidobacteria bacterium]|nr:response regulator [Acidobacteriota bacterium]NIM60559.1 response regulator [Acidobacteriota bacterium]NIO59530.1 response regulator [Acidobacteriota bacterium]NIQ30559.1 response regulator [Acidobacteriota bacterium]NIQ85507.1 response regulator [Acidobacteriota bacterium]